MELRYETLSLITLSLLSIGVIFYHFVEKFTWLDSIYFCVVTLATVGYGDIVPTTPVGKIFTIFYILIGVGILVSFFTTISTRLIDRRVNRKEERREKKE